MWTHRLRSRFLTRRQCNRDTIAAAIWQYRCGELTVDEALAFWQGITWGNARIPHKDWTGWLRHVSTR